MFMHATAHGGCTDTVRQSALEVDSGRNIPCCTGDSNPRQYYAWFFSRTLYQLSYTRPIYIYCFSPTVRLLDIDIYSHSSCALVIIEF